MDIKKLLSEMSLKEKICQLSQTLAAYICGDENQPVTGPTGNAALTDEELASVGSVLNFSGAANMIEVQRRHLKDDPHKIPLLFMHDVIHGYKTIFPIPLALACSFDTELAERCAHMAAEEAAVSGVHITFSPMADLVRDARWGRVMESAGEDPHLCAEMSAAFVRGYKGTVACCVKHFAAYGAVEAGRDYNRVDMSENTLRQTYLPAYKAAIDAGAETAMAAFTVFNGVPATANEFLLKKILREEWGFDGVVISDYAAVDELYVHGFSQTAKDCAEAAFNAGVDMEMVSVNFIKHAEELVAEGKISVADIDRATLRVLKLKDDLGLFDNPYGAADTEKEKEVCLSENNRLLAREAAAKSAVLLKNNGALPLSCGKKIIVTGPFADTGEIIGSWRCNGKAADAVTLYGGIKKYAPTAEFAESVGWGLFETAEVEVPFFDCDVYIFACGEHGECCTEGKCRAGLNLPEAQLKYLRKLKATGKPVISVVFGGRPLILDEVALLSDAVLYAWQPGTEGGNAIADIIFGKASPSGKLAMSFPRAAGQYPLYYNSYNTGRPKRNDADLNEAYTSSYQDVPNSPLFPFGYGLTYTDFEITGVKLSADKLEKGGAVTVFAAVKNIGKTGGTETVQLYIRDKFASVVRPIRELKGFKKVQLKPGESQKIAFTITEETLGFVNARNEFVTEAGDFDIMIGNSSDKLQTVTLVYCG